MDRNQSFPSVVRGGFGLAGRFIKQQPVVFALAATGGAMFAASIVAAAIVIGNVTDSLIVPVLDQGVAWRGRLLPAVLAVVGVSVWKAASITLRRAAAGWLQFRAQAELRARMIEHQLGLELAWFSGRSTGDLLSVSDADARQATFILAPLPYGTAATLLLIGTVVVVTVIDPVLGLIALAGLAMTESVNVIGSWRNFGEFERAQELRGAVGSIAHESFDGALTVRALGREEHETDRMREMSERLRDQLAKVGRIAGTYRAYVDVLPPATTVVILAVGALRLRSGAISPGELITITYLMSLLTVPIRLIGYVLWDLAESLAGWNRVDDVLQVDEFVRYGAIGPLRQNSGAALAGDAVGFAYPGESLVLSDLRVDIPPGRIVAVVGPTGAGKSTLALLLARLWDPTRGHIHLDGRDLRDFAPTALSAEVAYVPQEAFLFDDTVEGNITLGFDFPQGAVESAARLAAADEFITHLPDGYATRIGERGMTLSGGQRQRIVLARALIRKPRLLILDDATSAVDPSVESRILEGLREADLPSTVIVVAYRQSSITLADEVVFLDGGRVVAHSTHEDLLQRSDGYARLLQAYAQDAALRAAEGRRGEP